MFLEGKQNAERTETLTRAGVILGIPVLDHVIIGERGYYSYNAAIDHKGKVKRLIKA